MLTVYMQQSQKRLIDNLEEQGVWFLNLMHIVYDQFHSGVGVQVVWHNIVKSENDVLSCT